MSGKRFNFEKDPTRESAALHSAAAVAKGCKVVHPQANELQLDFDTHAQLGLFEANRHLFSALIADVKRTASPSQKAGRFHVTVTLVRPVRDVYERIMLQALMGSDTTREALSWYEAQAGVAEPCRLFERVP